MTAIVAAADLTRRYGEGEVAVDALRDVTVEFAAGRFAAIMGPSGSGKSTLLSLLLCFVDLQRGSFVAGRCCLG